MHVKGSFAHGLNLDKYVSFCMVCLPERDDNTQVFLSGISRSYKRINYYTITF